LLSWLNWRISCPAKPGTPSTRVIDALEIMTEYAENTWKVWEKLNFNKNYLSNLLKQETGLTFKEWVRNDDQRPTIC
jgi:methylphosphotriester-DNA--protein-cysteine methyltransferase